MASHLLHGATNGKLVDRVKCATNLQYVARECWVHLAVRFALVFSRHSVSCLDTRKMGHENKKRRRTASESAPCTEPPFPFFAPPFFALHPNFIERPEEGIIKIKVRKTELQYTSC